MSILRWRSSSQMFFINEEMGKMFDDAMEFLNMDPGMSTLWSPPCDLFETATSFTLKAEVPGIGLDEIVLEVAGDSVTLAGERRKSEEARSVSYHRMERAGGKFVRVFRLGCKVDEDNVQANLKDGLLTVILPKRSAAGARNVPIAG